MKKALSSLLALLVLAGVAAACGEREEPTSRPPAEKLDLVLDYFPNADHVGIYAAIAGGEFEKVGLEVTPRTPSDPAAPLKLLAAGRADLAISYEPEVLLARDRGLRVVSVGAIVQRPLTSIMAIRGSGVRDVRDLRNKRVGTAGIPYQSVYLRTILERAGVNPNSVDEIDVGFNLVPAMLSKRVDATLGSFWNYEGVELRQRRRDPTIIPVDRVGVPTYNELVIVARRDDLGKRGNRVRRFMRAVGAGYRSARRDPRRAVGHLLKANPDLTRRLQLASVRATMPAFFPRDPDRPFGWQDPRQWEVYGRWMYDNELVRRPPRAGRALTNEFLPGEGI